jgi:sarcosine oxidase subunit beta
VDTDVVVIGGGIVGIACARALALAGAGVTVLEAAPAIASGSTARANGGVRAQFRTAPNIAFSLRSIEAYEDLAARRPEVAFHQTGYLLMTGTASGERRLVDAVDAQRAAGVATMLLDPAEIAALAPMVRVDGVLVGAFHDRDGFLDPAGAAGALAADARAAGVRIVTGAGVHAARRDGGSWRIDHDRGTTVTSHVVNAAGPNARAVQALTGGTDVPVEPVRRNLAMFPDDPASPTPMLVDLDTGVLARREAAGGWIVAYSDPADPPGRETGVDPAFFEALAERTPNRFPFIADLPLDPARCWAGLYPETPDHHAVVGADPAAPGLILAVGFGGHGVMHAPAAGQAVAEVITTGAAQTFDLHPLRPARFAGDDLVVEANVF